MFSLLCKFLQVKVILKNKEQVLRVVDVDVVGGVDAGAVKVVMIRVLEELLGRGHPHPQRMILRFVSG